MKAAANDAEPKSERRKSSSPLRRDVQLHDRLEEAEAEVANLQNEAADLWCKLEASEARVKALEANEISLKGNYNWLKERLEQAQSAKAQLEIAVSDQCQRRSQVSELEAELAVSARCLHRLRMVAGVWVEDFYRIRTRVALLQRGFRGWVLWLCRVDLTEIETLAMERRLPD
jgi:chromosome segregation ATPase